MLRLTPADHKRTALAIGSGGGRDVVACRIADVGHVTAVELNPDVVAIVRDQSEFNGGIYDDGPDLTVVGRRFNKRDLLETIVDPNKSISDQYQATEFELVDGRLVTGRVVNLNGNTYMVQPDMMTPNKLVNIKTDDIEEQRPSSVSTMPAGLLDNLTKDEILDLMAYLRSGGKRDFEELKQTAKD